MRWRVECGVIDCPIVGTPYLASGIAATPVGTPFMASAGFAPPRRDAIHGVRDCRNPRRGAIHGVRDCRNPRRDAIHGVRDCRSPRRGADAAPALNGSYRITRRAAHRRPYNGVKSVEAGASAEAPLRRRGTSYLHSPLFTLHSITSGKPKGVAPPSAICGENAGIRRSDRAAPGRNPWRCPRRACRSSLGRRPSGCARYRRPPGSTR